ncbi:hypothetical protein MNB_SV-13-1767 [hydrothermal vent metagenome]|uniref:Uncharacterized protein n=1 Tax=hydrothermal vent metagenome TaxID=652676 RepID=A0A1W1CJ51_9ZZZZ
MILQISVKDEKSELFLALIQELKNSMIEKIQIISPKEDFFDEKELSTRVDEIKNKKIKPLSREEVFDGIC